MNPDELNQFLEQIPSALICYVVVFFIGLFGLMIYFGIVKPARRRRKLSELNATQSAADMQAVESAHFNTSTSYPVASPRTPQAPQTGPTVEYRVRLSDGHMTQVKQLLAVARDLEDDRLLVYLDGTGYRSMTENPEVKEKFSRLMRELAETIAKPDTPRPVQTAATDDAYSDAGYDNAGMEMADLPEMSDDDFDLPDVDLLTSPTDDVPAAPPVTFSRPAEAAPAQPVSRPASTSLPPAPNSTIPGALPNYRTTHEDAPTKRPGLFRPKVEFEPVPELNLAAAIEAYLQHKLHFSGDYADRRLHIHSAPGGGVRIQVDDRYYDAVSDIEDPAIRQFIAETIQEWQDQQ